MTRYALFAALLALSLPAFAAPSESCSSVIGQDKAETLVSWCRDVSPATRPPCNANNACWMIIDEIRRGCLFIADGKLTSEIVDIPPYCLITDPPAKD